MLSASSLFEIVTAIFAAAGAFFGAAEFFGPARILARLLALHQKLSRWSAALQHGLQSLEQRLKGYRRRASQQKRRLNLLIVLILICAGLGFGVTMLLPQQGYRSCASGCAGWRARRPQMRRAQANSARPNGWRLSFTGRLPKSHRPGRAHAGHGRVNQAPHARRIASRSSVPSTGLNRSWLPPNCSTRTTARDSPRLSSRPSRRAGASRPHGACAGPTARTAGSARGCEPIEASTVGSRACSGSISTSPNASTLRRKPSFSRASSITAPTICWRLSAP